MTTHGELVAANDKARLDAEAMPYTWDQGRYDHCDDNAKLLALHRPSDSQRWCTACGWSEHIAWPDEAAVAWPCPRSASSSTG